MNRTVSPEARQFIDDNLPTAEAVQVDLHNIDQIRSETIASYQPAIDFARDQYTESLDKIFINGVECLRIKPKYLNSDLSDVRLLYFFGGAFIQGSPEEDLPINGYLANALGVIVIAPYYRRAPENPSPAAYDDGFAVYQHLLDSHGADNILTAGESAGGNLTLKVLLRSLKQGDDAPKGCALFSPWCDLSHSGDADQFNNGRDPTISKEHGVMAAKLFAGDHDLRSISVSPLYDNFNVEFPKTLITSGTRDLLLSQCVRLSTVMRQHNLEVELRIWENMWHVFEFYPDIPESFLSLAEISQFLKGCLDR